MDFTGYFCEGGDMEKLVKNCIDLSGDSDKDNAVTAFNHPEENFAPEEEAEYGRKSPGKHIAELRDTAEKKEAGNISDEVSRSPGDILPGWPGEILNSFHEAMKSIRAGIKLTREKAVEFQSVDVEEVKKKYHELEEAEKKCEELQASLSLQEKTIEMISAEKEKLSLALVSSANSSKKEKEKLEAQIEDLQEQLSSAQNAVSSAKKDGVKEYLLGRRNKARAEFTAVAYYILGAQVAIRQMSEHYKIDPIQFNPRKTYKMKARTGNPYTPPAARLVIGDAENVDDILEVWEPLALPEGEVFKSKPAHTDATQGTKRKLDEMETSSRVLTSGPSAEKKTAP